MAEPKVLALDIETRPAVVYAWKLFDVNVAVNQIVEVSRIICVAATWVGEDKAYFFADWLPGGRTEMLKGIYNMMAEADAVITYNGDKFDLTKLRGEFLLEGFPPLPPLTSIDLYKTVKKLGFQSGKLEFIGPFLGLGDKVKHEGFSLWTKVMSGDEAAQSRMQNYCIGDVLLTVKLYLLIRPYITNHPHMGSEAHACGACGSNKIQSRGYRRTKSFKIQRLHCQSCGSWQDGKRSKV
jgi:uncharacterized protein YprB with RNaseH-like and TPR domain